MKQSGGTVKITGGKLRGRTIDTPGDGTHPMGERERIALFNIIGNKLKGKRVLDAYAGGGTLGIEAASRGADDILFVEESPFAMRVANMNCMKLRVPEDKVAFYRGSVSKFYKNFVQGQATAMLIPEMAAALDTFPEEVDIIFADPPYGELNTKEVSRLANAYLVEDGILVLSHADDAPEMPGLELKSTHSYARANISVYRKLD